MLPFAQLADCGAAAGKQPGGRGPQAATPKCEAKRRGDSDHSNDCMGVSSGGYYASHFAGSAHSVCKLTLRSARDVVLFARRPAVRACHSGPHPVVQRPARRPLAASRLRASHGTESGVWLPLPVGRQSCSHIYGIAPELSRAAPPSSPRSHPMWSKYSNLLSHRKSRLYHRLRFGLSSAPLLSILSVPMDGTG